MTMKSFTDIQLPDMTDAYRQVQEKAKKLDPVGKEDGDVDNDGDKDSSDEYLMKRRKAIGKAMKKEDVEMDEATLATARKNIGRDPKKKSCWKGYTATTTKMKDGRAVPDCKKEEVEQIDEISADLALKASKKADIERGKAAHAGDKERAVSKLQQAKRLYKKQAAKRLGK